MSPPRIFISYSHDSDQHKNWVRQLAERLRTDGVDVVLDQWDLGLGADVTEFMEHNLATCSRVLVICTETYVDKANTLNGGTGYERMIITAEIAKNLTTSKFIPVLRSGDTGKLPRFLGTRIYCDFRPAKYNNSAYEELLRELHESPKHERPPIGRSPFEDPSKGNLKRPNDVATAPKYHWHRAVQEHCGNKLYLIFVRFSKDSVFIKESILDDIRRSGISDYIVFGLLSTWDALIRVWADQEGIETLRKKLAANSDVHPEKQPEYLVVEDIAHFSEEQRYKPFAEVKHNLRNLSLRELRDVQQQGIDSESFERLTSLGLLLEDSNRYHPRRIQFYTLVRSVDNLGSSIIRRLRDILDDAKHINNRSLFLTSGTSTRVVLKGQVDDFYDISKFVVKIAPEVASLSAVTETMVVANQHPNQSTTIDFQKAEAFVAYREFRELCPAAWQLDLSEQRKLEGMYAGIRDIRANSGGNVLIELLRAKAANSPEQLSQALALFFPPLEKLLRDKLVPVLLSEYGTDWQTSLDTLKKSEGVTQSNKDLFALGDSLKIYKKILLDKHFHLFTNYTQLAFSNLMDAVAPKRNEFAHGFSDFKRWDELFSFFAEFIPVYSKLVAYLNSIDGRRS